MGWGGVTGTKGWGGLPWGAGGTALRLLTAEAVRENVVRLGFNQAIRFSGVFDPGDAANPERYVINAVAGTVGLDELPVRDVSPIVAELAAVESGGGSFIDVTLDRPMSPYPCRYVATVNQIVSETGTLLEPGFTTLSYFSVFKGLPVIAMDLAVARRDFANPQTFESLLDPLPVTNDPTLLGGYPVDDGGDYAIDEGLTSYKKRVIRRLTTRKGAFAHLPNYGVGVPDRVKRLGGSSYRQALAADAESQIKEEPETLAVSVRAISDPNYPSLLILRVRAKTNTGEEMKKDVPFAPTGEL